MPTRPLVARRHLFRTGTLRYFAVRYTNLENFDMNLNTPLDDAEGLVLYTLPANEHEVVQLRKKACEVDTEKHKAVLIAIPYSVGFLIDAVSGLAYLDWVQENTLELEGDAVARRELSVRRIEAERDVSKRLKEIFWSDSEGTCTWYRNGQPVDTINSQRTRNAYLSKLCDEVYDETPIIRNELINRRKISGAVTAARKKLIQRMLKDGDKKNLGITGYPAEMSIYRSLLLNTGIHRKVEGVWGFHPPKTADANRMAPTWKAIEKFLAEV